MNSYKENVKIICDALNRTNYTYKVPSDKIKYSEYQGEIPESFYECFGTGSDPLRVFLDLKNHSKYIHFVINDPSLVCGTTPGAISRYIKQGYTDLIFLHESLLLVTKNKHLQKLLGDGSAESVQLEYKMDGHKLPLSNACAINLRYFLGQNEFIEGIKSEDGYNLLKLYPTIVGEIKDLYEGIKKYNNLVSNYKSAGYYEELHAGAERIIVPDSLTQYKTIDMASIEAFAKAIPQIESIGGKVIYYSPGVLVVSLPEYTNDFSFMSGLEYKSLKNSNSQEWC